MKPQPPEDWASYKNTPEDPMDLEQIIRNKQDQLRGRPRDWLDDFKEWRSGFTGRHIEIALHLALVPLTMGSIIIYLALFCGVE
ncbi:hypothetical protein GCM10007908_03550 [Rhizobium albus]|nr:hypothetical protein GCM10007908_03550 [Rhizobium albus]